MRLPTAASAKLWHGTSLARKILWQALNGVETPRLLLTDIDGTFIDKQAERGESQAVRRLTQYLAQKNYGLVAITGRDLPMMVRDHKKGILPLFDVVITSVGTERYILRSGTYTKDTRYERYLAETIGFDRGLILSHCQRFLTLVNGTLAPRHSFLKHVSLRLQPRDRSDATRKGVKSPQPFKISFNFYGDKKVSAFLYETFRALLDQAGLENIRLVFSVEPRASRMIKNNIDVVPLEKSGAATMLIEEVQAAFGDIFSVYAGDSMNDYDAIQSVGDAAVVVGNADPELIAQLGLSRSFVPVRHIGRKRVPRYIYVGPTTIERGPVSLLSGVRSLEVLLASQTATAMAPDLL